MIGHCLPDTVMGCLHQAVQHGVQAEGAASLWNVQLRGGPAVDGARHYRGNVPEFEMLQINSAGAGARPTKDGLSATAFPSGVRGMPVEANEAITPVVFWRKEFRADSGGAGRQRGGLGQIMEIGGAGGIPFDVLAMFERVRNPARGRAGGKGGAAGRVRLGSGKLMRGKGRQSIPPDDRLRLEMPGGGGHGDPFERPAETVAADVKNGLVSRANARRLYGVVLKANGSIDRARTRALRGHA